MVFDVGNENAAKIALTKQAVNEGGGHFDGDDHGFSHVDAS